jgi:glutamate-1-semialdehyde 2,1-aminomutase
MAVQHTTPADELFARARGTLASGVSASMRLHPYLGRPFYHVRGEGPYLFDLEGKRYIDYNVSNGATMLGHHHPAVHQAVQEGLDAGIIAAAETPFHEALAETLSAIIPSIERVRYASTGTEVTMVAIRIARQATGRKMILKFDGHFHGLSEPFLYQRDNPHGADGAVVPSSGGVTPSGAPDVIMAPWNDAEAVETQLQRHGDDLAAIICEPVWYNAGCVPPAPGFLELLRQRTTELGAILIFDEVLSGFRMALGGAQEYYGVTPDLCTLAKALANGMPLSVVAGRADLMALLAPTGPVAHSGTYSGHLLSVLAAVATLNELRQPGVYDRINATAASFYSGMQEVFDRHGLPILAQGLGTRFGLYFGRREPVRAAADLAYVDQELQRAFVLGCLARGVYLHAYRATGQLGHAGFSLAHSAEDFATTLEIMDTVAAGLARGGAGAGQ